MGKIVAYIRVSSKDQNLDRQLEELKKLGIEEKYIYQDKQSRQGFWKNWLSIYEKIIRKRRYTSNQGTR